MSVVLHKNWNDQKNREKFISIRGPVLVNFIFALMNPEKKNHLQFTIVIHWQFAWQLLLLHQDSSISKNLLNILKIVFKAHGFQLKNSELRVYWTQFTAKRLCFHSQIEMKSLSSMKVMKWYLLIVNISSHLFIAFSKQLTQKLENFFRERDFCQFFI
jgi:hypothetical protein